MNFKKKSKVVKSVTVLLALSLYFSTIIRESYANGKTTISNTNKYNIELCNINSNYFVKGKDIWLVGDKEMDKLPDELLNELQKDPYVKEQLGLENTEVQKNSPLDKEFSYENTSSINHIKLIDGTNISDVLITGENVGIVIEKSLTDKFELDYVGVEDINNFTFSDTINSDGTLQITISANSLVNYINVDSTNKVNVVNIKIPEKVYNNFSINVENGAIYLPNIMGKINVDSNKSSIKVRANQFESNLNLNLQKSLLEFDVTRISNDINIEGTGNSVSIVFNEKPKNLKLDATKCKGSLDLPNNWSKNYEIGTNNPIINLNIKGGTKIIVK